MYHVSYRAYYDTDDQFLRRCKEFQNALPILKSEGKLSKEQNNNERFPFVLKIDDSVQLSGHSILLEIYGPGRYSLIDGNHGLLFASSQEIRSHVGDKNFGQMEIEGTNSPRYGNRLNYFA
jgi:hypothetical protein